MTIAHQKKQSNVEYLLSDPLKKAQQFSYTVEIGNFFGVKLTLFQLMITVGQ